MLVLHHAGGGALAVSGSGDGGGVENGELTLRLVSSKPQLTVADEKKAMARRESSVYGYK